MAFGASQLIETKNVVQNDYRIIQEMMHHNYEWTKLDDSNSLHFLSEKHLTYLCYTCYDMACPMCLVAHYG